MMLDQIANELRREVRVMPRNTPASIEQAERIMVLAEEVEQAHAVVRQTRACLAMLERELNRLEVAAECD